MCGTSTLFAFLLPFVSSSPVLAQACTPEWSDAFGSAAGYGVSAMATWDSDGAGPEPERLYMGRYGGFDSWDGAVRTQITYLTLSVSPFTAEVYAIVPFDPDGAGPLPEELVVGGAFETVGGMPATYIARWNGTSWSTLGTGMNGRVFALRVFDEDGPGPNPPRLFAGGEFTTASGVNARGIARWDGSSWTAVGPSAGSVIVNVLGSWDADATGAGLPVLVAGGSFSAIGGTSADNIARWNGAAWTAMGSVVSFSVECLAEFDDDGAGPLLPRLYAGSGIMTGSSGLAYWNGSSWVGVGSQTGGYFASLLVHDEDGPGPLPEALFAAGEFTAVNGVSANAIARWSGGAWSALGTGLTADTPPFRGRVLASYDDDGAGPSASRLYVGGFFTLAGGKPAHGVGRWDGSAWACMERGLESTGRAIAQVDLDGPGGNPPGLFVGGDFKSAGEVQAASIAQWTGSGWSALGGGLTYSGFTFGRVAAIAEFDEDGTGPNPPRLFATGFFALADGLPAANIARWDGSAWSAVGSGLDSEGYALAVFDEDGAGPNPPALFVGGQFANAGGIPATGIARWNGTSWSAVSGGAAGTVYALHVADLGTGAALYVGGYFSSPGARIAKWNGTSWSALLTGLNGGSGGPVVYSLHAADLDGAGPAPKLLYVGGRFTTAGAASANRVAAWNGTSWSGLGAGLGDASTNFFVFSLASFEPTGAGGPSELYAGGFFLQNLGGVFNWNMGRWNGTAWVSAPSLNVELSGIGAGAMTVFDPDGIGPERPGLYVTGDFTHVDGESSERMALLRCESSAPSADFCFPGTGGVIACPCGQPANPSGGCANHGAGATSGAALSASGAASLTADTVVLTTSNHRSPAIGVLNVFFSYKPGSATPTLGNPSGAGVRCIGTGGDLRRLYTMQVFGGTGSKPGMGDPSVSARSASFVPHTISPGETRYYFNVYRDGQAAGPCGNPLTSTNLTNGTSILWSL